MSNYYLCETCAVKHVGGELQSFLPYFQCAERVRPLEGMLVVSDGEKPSEVCPAYKPKVVEE